MDLIVEANDILECFNVLPHAAISRAALGMTDFDFEPVAEYVIWRDGSGPGYITEVFSCKFWLPEFMEDAG